MDDYLDRLANVVNQERTEGSNFYYVYLEQRSRFLFPERVQTINPSKLDESISLLDFLSLYGCQLQTLVAERNSSLGKQSRPSQVLLYELAFLEHSPACIKDLREEGKTELAEQLSRVSRNKQETLPTLIWQTVIQGEEVMQFWRQAHDIGQYPEQDVMSVTSSLKALGKAIEAWLQGDYRYGRDQLEGHLGILGHNDGGALLKAFLLYSLAMDEANSLLDDARLCFKSRPLFNTLAAQNVVSKFFVGQVQSWAARLSQRYYELLPHYQALEVQLADVESLEYRAWRHRRDAFFEAAIQSSKPHVQRLSVLLNGCSGNSWQPGVRHQISESGA